MPTRITRRKKCFSKCRKKTESECGNIMCKYVNGQKYKYCRLSHKYKLDESCNITKKKKKINKKTAKLMISNFIKTKYSKSKDIKAVDKIQKFMRNTKFKRQSKFLNTICSDSGVCLAFGNSSATIKMFFNKFVDFTFAKSPIKRIGQPSANGFVNEIEYRRENYMAHTILKSSLNPTADNLFYEYMVGLFINKLNRQFPCFLETYGVYQYKDENSWNNIKDESNISMSSVKRNMKLIDDGKIKIQEETKFKQMIEDSCNSSTYICIMTQHIKNAYSINTALRSIGQYKDDFFRNDLVNILFQIYMPLALNSNRFTHYDLHTDNVLLYSPYNDAYIEFHYQLPDGTMITFKNNYMSKIIDYGRSFYKENDDNNSKKIHDVLCDSNNCDDCGNNVGYAFLNSSISIRHQYYIHSVIPNKSHDLRLLDILKRKSKQYKIYKTRRNTYTIYNLFKDLIYNTEYGTPEKQNSFPQNISTVNDLFKGLLKIMRSEEYITKNISTHQHLRKAGDLYIYSDGTNMKYISHL